MRILFLTAENWPTFRADVAVLFGKWLPRWGITSDLIAGKSSSHEPAAPWGGGAALLCDAGSSRSAQYLRTFLYAVYKMFTAPSLRYEAIQVRDMPVIAALGVLAARLKGLPFFYWMSFPLPEGKIARAAERGLAGGLGRFLFPWISGRVDRFLLYRWVLPRAAHVFVQSDRMLAEMVVRGVPAHCMTAVPMGVDMETLDNATPLPTEDARLKGRTVIVYLGSLERPRRIEVMFETLAIVCQQIPNAVLVIVGDTEDPLHRQWLEARSREAGVADRVVWTGWLPTAEAWRYVAAAEVGLSPIPRGALLDVSSPTKILEYMALGIPVVCNDSPDQEQVINSCGAGFCVPYTPQTFAAAIVQMLALDAGSRRAMVASGQRFVRAQRDYSLLGRMLAEKYQSLQAGRLAPDPGPRTAGGSK